MIFSRFIDWFSRPARVARRRVPAVLLLRKQHDPTDDIYVEAPLRRLAAERLVRFQTLEFSRPYRAEALLEFPTLIISRYLDDGLIDFIERHRARFERIVYLFDDDLRAAAAEPTLPEGYRRMIGEFAERRFPRLLALADLWVVTSPELAARYAAPHTRLLEPTLYYPRGWLTDPRRLKHFERTLDPRATLELAYAGSTTHAADLAAIAPALRGALERHPRARLTLIGCEPPPELRGAPRVRHLAQLPWPRYKRLARGLRLHLGLAPLLGTPWNACKSRIKWIEYAQFGAAAIYSGRPPYDPLIRAGRDGWLAADDPAAWAALLDELLARPEALRAAAAEALARAAELADPRAADAFWRDLLRL